MDPAVLEAMLPYFTDHFGNASSSHSFGAECSTAIKAAREQVQALIGAAHSHEIIITSGGTESDNGAIPSALEMGASGAKANRVLICCEASIG